MTLFWHLEKSDTLLARGFTLIVTKKKTGGSSFSYKFSYLRRTRGRRTDPKVGMQLEKHKKETNKHHS